MEHVFDPISRLVVEIEFSSEFVLTWYKYSLMIMLGIIAAAVLGIREGKRLGIKTDDIIDGLLIILPLSIVGTRLWYVIFEWERYAWDIGKIINITDGGLAIHGGFITAFVSAYFFTKKRNINIFSVFDIMSPGFLIAQASGRWGNFFNQEAHGGVIGGVDDSGAAILSLDEQRSFLDNVLHLPKFISDNMLIKAEHVAEGTMVPDLSPGSSIGDMINVAYYHPTFLYESVWNLVGFIIMLVLRRTKFLKTGELLGGYLIWYSVGRFFIEGIRTDSLYVLNTGLRTAQLISVLMILGGVIYLYLIRKVWKNNAYCEVLAQYEGVDVNYKEDKKNMVEKPNKHTRLIGEKRLEQNTNDNKEVEL